MEDAPPPADSAPHAAGPDPDAGLDVTSKAEEWRLLRLLTGLLPGLFYRYERLCKWVASDGVHNLGFFASTFFCAPAGLYVWESRKGGFFRRLFRGVLAWFLLTWGLVVFVNFGWALALVTLVPGRPFRWIVRRLGLARTRPAPGIPKKLTFEFVTLDIVSLVFMSVVFLVFVANRDELSRMDFVSDSDPVYHMAVAKQILDHHGELPEWDRWEYAPFGRPHLYHPAVHYLIAFFSWKTGDVLYGFNTVQMLLYPLALVSGWYFARWMFGAVGGFLALVFLSMDTAFLLSQVMVLPAALVTALVPLILLFFLARRTIPTVILLTIALYTHGPVGVPEFVVLGLFVFSVRHREYFPFFRKVMAFAGLLLVPWLGFRTLSYGAWFGTSSGAMGAKNAAEIVKLGVVQLQIISPILLFLAFRTWWRDKDARLGAVKSLLIGFLPMLLVYGGRYFMHTAPLWAILIARNFGGWLGRHEEAAEAGEARKVGTARGPDGAARARKSMRRRVLAFLALAFVPLPVISTGMGAGQGPHVWPGFTGANATVAVALMRTPPDRDFETMAEFMRLTMPAERISGRPPPPDGGEKGREQIRYSEHLASDEYARLRRRIVHVGREPYGSPYLANRITVATGLRTDSGGWSAEVRSDLMLKEVERARREDPECLFVFRKKGQGFTWEEMGKLKEEHGLDWTRAFGEKYLVGGRGVAQAAGVIATPPEGEDVF